MVCAPQPDRTKQPVREPLDVLALNAENAPEAETRLHPVPKSPRASPTHRAKHNPRRKRGRSIPSFAGAAFYIHQTPGRTCSESAGDEPTGFPALDLGTQSGRADCKVSFRGRQSVRPG